MNLFVLCLLFIVNFAISWFNAWAVGKAWAEAKLAGGWQRFVAWSGAIMSACGFTWCISLVVGILAFYTLPLIGWHIPHKYIEGYFALGYLTIVPPIIGTGLVLMVDSWAYAWRRRTLGSTGVAAWNTYAEISNIVDAVGEFPDAIGKVVKMFTDDEDSDDAMGYIWKILAFLLFSVAIVGGILMTRTILMNSARAHNTDLREELGNHPARFSR